MRLYPPIIMLIHAAIVILISTYDNIATSAAAITLGTIVSIIGLALFIYCFSLFQKHKTKIRPFEKSTSLIQEGPYKYSRNPVYFAMTLFLLGVCLATANMWTLLFIPLFMVIITISYIIKEEEMLKKTFGKKYAEYCARVRRWL